MGPGVRKLLWLDFYRREHHNNVTMYEPLFCLSSNFVQSLKNPKYTISQNFSQIGIFFAILCHFFIFVKKGKILFFLTHGQKSGKNRNFKNSFHNFFYFALKYHVSKFQVDKFKIDENNTQRTRARESAFY